MAKTTVELSLSSIFGAILLVVGIIILLIIAITTFELATGFIQPLQVLSGNEITPENASLLGVLLQIGMFLVLVIVAYTFMRFGYGFIEHED